MSSRKVEYLDELARHKYSLIRDPELQLISQLINYFLQISRSRIVRNSNYSLSFIKNF